MDLQTVLELWLLWLTVKDFAVSSESCVVSSVCTNFLFNLWLSLAPKRLLFVSYKSQKRAAKYSQFFNARKQPSMNINFHWQEMLFYIVDLHASILVNCWWVAVIVATFSWFWLVELQTKALFSSYGYTFTCSEGCCNLSSESCVVASVRTNFLSDKQPLWTLTYLPIHSFFNYSLTANTKYFSIV